MTCFRYLPPIAAALFLASQAEAGTRSLALVAPTNTGNGFEFYRPLWDSIYTFGYTRFALPADFKKDSVAKLRFTFQAKAAGAYPCAMVFRLGYVERGRPGKNQVGGPPASVGFPSGGSAAIAFSGTIAVTKTYKMVGLTSGPLQGQREGDTFSVSFDRDGNNTEDTCGDIDISAVQLIYATP